MAKLGELYSITSGGTPSRKCPEYFEGGTISWVKTGDLKYKYLYATDEQITQAALDNSSAKLYPAETVLIAMYGATIGATSILKIDAATNQACAAFVKRDDILPQYLHAFLESQRERFIREAVGGAQPNISAGYLKTIEFPMCSIERQQEITTILELMNSLIKNHKLQLDKLDELVKSRFIEMFENRGYPVIAIKDVLWQQTQTEKFSNTKEEIFVTVSIRGGGAKRRIIKDGKYPVPFSGYRVKGGQFIYSRIDARNGAFAILPDELNNAVVSKDFPVFDILTEKIMPSVLLFSVLQESFIKQIQNNSFGATNRQRIKENIFGNYTITLPPLDLQNQFVDFVAQVDKSKLAVQKSLEQLEILKKSLMQEYFG